MEKIAERMKGQDNLATADPIYMVVQDEIIVGLDPQWCAGREHITWFHDDWYLFEGDGVKVYEGYEEETTFEKLEDHWEETGEEVGDWTRTGYQIRSIYVQPFFSEKGAEKYIEENRHNLKNPRVFVESAYRNDEWQAARRYLIGLLEGDGSKCKR
jgi:hypothetical protein